ncbi:MULTISPECIES: LysE family translocator [Pseudomonas]|jgi:threonine/homoserine/homoserine lactone efflux protein|uniref:Threonine/homoserine/homoserine lactone efflux protein n=2 Tax=Pseudomonas TaxID=286 RepID=A0A9X8EP08_PSEPU|nr:MULTISPECIES: LysE family translocator [Pseudomonas]KTC24185.1 lysine transporter LysE [Pseudomonas putida]MBG8559424.1 LysE family translocator [Pseudomonas qingdaonensis]MCO7505746.1 LysE family translocator [Pseudomonas sp. VE 267-6A]MCO7530582.1 LysE family translocator [Pseudomonas sp. 2]MCQ0169929.1 LysE family translocator [Pseudomonas sp. S12(2018)]
MSLSLSMAAFALAASISPGPVNIVALGAGARHGLRPAMRHVTGATLGFILLLVLIGLGLHEVLRHWPGLAVALHWAGVLFLLYMAWKLARDDGALGEGRDTHAPSLLRGAAMQWLNPKAWLACVAGIGAFVGQGETALLGQFSLIYLVICYLSLGCWALAGSLIRSYLDNPRRLRLFNRSLAALLVLSALYLMQGSV